MELHADSKRIDAIGTTTEVASIFRVAPQAVSQWRRAGIPKARRQTMALMYPALFEGEERNEAVRCVELPHDTGPAVLREQSVAQGADRAPVAAASNA
jgi:hypothetical protein